jgi:hypothetical protein
LDYSNRDTVADYIALLETLRLCSFDRQYHLAIREIGYFDYPILEIEKATIWKRGVPLRIILDLIPIGTGGFCVCLLTSGIGAFGTEERRSGGR